MLFLRQERKEKGIHMKSDRDTFEGYQEQEFSRKQTDLIAKGWTLGTERQRVRRTSLEVSSLTFDSNRPTGQELRAGFLRGPLGR